MRDSELIKKVKDHGGNTDAVWDMLLELLKAKEVTMEQVKKCLDADDGEWPFGYPHDNNSRTMVLPTFATRLGVEYERQMGLKHIVAS